IEGVSNIERLALVTGGGDDQVYLYGLNAELELLINTGSDNDEVILGGEEQTFEVIYPESQAVYTVERSLIEDQAVGDELIKPNEVVFNKRDLNGSEIETLWREFYHKWVRPDLSADDEEILQVRMDMIHWKLLEANLSVALKLYSQAVEKAREAPSHNTTLWDKIEWSTVTSEIYRELNQAFNGASQYASDVDAFEAALLNAVGTTVDGVYQNQDFGTNDPDNDGDWEDYFALGSTAPILPDTIDFQTLLNIAPDRAILNTAQEQALDDLDSWNDIYDRATKAEDRDLQAGNRSLDYVFFQEYLRKVVGFTIWGDFAHSDQIYLSTNNGDNRLDGWGYDPDLYRGDLYRDQMVVGERTYDFFFGNFRFPVNMPHVEGETRVWIPDDMYSEGQGSALFRDLISMFYDPEAVMPNDDNWNVRQDYEGNTYIGDASYRFDDLTQRTVTKILPANFDLDRIAGNVRLAGGPGAEDKLTVNIVEASGAQLDVGRIDLNLAEFNYNVDNDLISFGSTLDKDDLLALITHDDIQGALERANKQEQVGVLDDLDTGAISDATVTVQVDTVEGEVLKLSDELSSLLSAANISIPNDPDSDLDSQRSDFLVQVENFAKKGQELLGLKDASGNDIVGSGSFSLDRLEALLNDSVLLNWAYGFTDADTDDNSDAKDLITALEEVKAFITLSAAKSQLSSDYSWHADTALKVYTRSDLDLSQRSANYEYSQEIWDEILLENANDWFMKVFGYAQLVGIDEGSDEVLASNDTTGETLRLLRIAYTVGAAGNTVSGFVGGTEALKGNTIEMEKAYIEAINKLNTSYYTYAYYGVDSNADPILEAMAINRFNAEVAHEDLLEYQVGETTERYLTADNWTSYRNALLADAGKTAADLAAFRDAQLIAAGEPAIVGDDSAIAFTEENVDALIQLTQLQTGVAVQATLQDGLILQKHGGANPGEEFSLDIASVQDTAGFYLPETITVNKTTTIDVTVDSDYVQGRIANSEYDVSYDTITLQNTGWELWLRGFENATFNVNVDSTSDIADTVNITDGVDWLDIQLNTGDGS
ncbi:MAG: hypothetical protein VXZ35_06080, partial [Pseudomonadota bacterium]|nr:hypothetical protein [Pseudomonadota bacterium]